MSGLTACVFPGQGAQRVGIGRDLFDRFPDLTAQADDVLGYSIRELCLDDPGRNLGKTNYTQPALFVVSALSWLDEVERTGVKPAFLAGHSLGEYVALFAAEAFDFRTGVMLTRTRGELMSQARNGGMAAVMGLAADRIEALLAGPDAPEVEIANINSPSQVVVSGPRAAVEAAEAQFLAAGAQRYMVLNVSAAFHSRLMAETQRIFSDYLSQFTIRDPKIPVIANTSARAYAPGAASGELVAQITGQVRWSDTVQHLRAMGVETFREIGPARVLTGLIGEIEKTLPAPPRIAANPQPKAPPALMPAPVSNPAAEALGSAAFRKAWGVRYAYVAGAMYKGIASPDLVVRMGQAGLIGFLGAGGQPLERIEADIRDIQQRLGPAQAFGVNLISQPAHPELEDQTVDLLLRLGVSRAEASAFVQITPALVRFRLAGIHTDAAGRVVTPNQILAKLSRPEVAEAFMSPPPEKLLAELVSAGALTQAQADLGRRIPMAQDICVEADSGGHTDRGSPYVLLPAIQSLRDAVMAEQRYPEAIRVGAAGGIGAPGAAAAAFIMGADFILTGSINQCTVEAGVSDAVKDILQDLNVQDTAYAPAGDMFELGAKVQVVKKGLFFAARANRLHELYRQYDSLDALPAAVSEQIEQRYFRRSFEEVWEETRAHYASARPDVLARAEVNPKQKMALTFRWYFIHTMRLALSGDQDRKVDYQIHCGPALGAFNQWVRNTELQSWRRRHADGLAEAIMTGAAALLTGAAAAAKSEATVV